MTNSNGTPAILVNDRHLTHSNGTLIILVNDRHLSRICEHGKTKQFVRIVEGLEFVNTEKQNNL